MTRVPGVILMKLTPKACRGFYSFGPLSFPTAHRTHLTFSLFSSSLFLATTEGKSFTSTKINLKSELNVPLKCLKSYKSI